MLCDLIIYKHDNYTPIENMAELGVGGGGKQVFLGYLKMQKSMS